ncbi:hypothetical protein TWF696_009263 [Orbilia brochopaga]|uniref:Uncharacterized protein n=1 Tax=Orbilia brochopaga TaxID=3140254 RepID=A0AAV9UJ67_9PEZI
MFRQRQLKWLLFRTLILAGLAADIVQAVPIKACDPDTDSGHTTKLDTIATSANSRDLLGNIARKRDASAGTPLDEGPTCKSRELDAPSKHLKRTPVSDAVLWDGLSFLRISVIVCPSPDRVLEFDAEQRAAGNPSWGPGPWHLLDNAEGEGGPRQYIVNMQNACRTQCNCNTEAGCTCTVYFNKQRGGLARLRAKQGQVERWLRDQEANPPDRPPPEGLEETQEGTDQVSVGGTEEPYYVEGPDQYGHVSDWPRLRMSSYRGSRSGAGYRYRPSSRDVWGSNLAVNGQALSRMFGGGSSLYKRDDAEVCPRSGAGSGGEDGNGTSEAERTAKVVSSCDKSRVREETPVHGKDTTETPPEETSIKNPTGGI